MAKVKPTDESARFCVSVSTYYSTRIEAESAFLAQKDVAADKTIELWEWSDDDDDWIDTDWAGYEEE
jgi:hypothetical protein